MAVPEELTQLRQELASTLRRAEKNRRIIRATRTPIYLIAALWMIFVLAGAFAGGIFLPADQGAAAGSLMQWILPAFILLMILQFVFRQAYASFAQQERNVLSKLIENLFPEAKFHATAHDVPASVFRNSLFFPGFRSAAVFASLDIETGNGKTLNVADIGLFYGQDSPAGAGGWAAVYKSVFKPLFSSRADRALYDFRGMFAWAQLNRRVPGSVVILPDRLEDRLGYLAKSIQNLKNTGDRKLVLLEDPEFERRFAVYATDEVLARYILTPALMRDLTRLKERYGRDMMVSFNADKVCFAVPMPDGFLTLRSDALDDGRIVEEIYRDIDTTRSILAELRLENAVEKE